MEREAENYPDSFDLRNVDTDDNGEGDTSFVTGVKVQNPYGTCWGFAAISAAESSLIASGLATADSIDLSEKHLSYFAASHLDDPSNPQNGEGMYFTDLTDKDLATSAYRYDTGGTTLYATSLFASGIGPVREDGHGLVLEDGTPVNNNYLEYSGIRKEKIVRRVAVAYDSEGKPTEYAGMPVWYSEDDDWSIPDSYRFLQSYRLKESIILPSPMNGNKDAINALKQQMYKKHRAICICYCAETFLPGQDTSDTKYTSDHWAHYTSELEMSNHSVTIVGWDDNYPKENFKTEPPGKGAFLVKNSWGAETEEFPNNGYRHWGLLEGLDSVPYDESAVAKSNKSTGYFWMSYYDKSLHDPETFVFEEVTAENNFDIDQLDFMQASTMDYNNNIDTRSANVFTCRQTSELKEISVMTTVPATEVSYEVYMLPENFDDPVSGVKIAEGTQTFEYGGYHRISLNETGVLAKNQKYSVVVTESVNGDRYTPFTTYILETDRSPYSRAVVNKGESFCCIDGQWKDISDRAVQEEIINFSNDYMDNFPIKAYLKPVSDGYLSVSNWEEGTPGSFDLFTEEQKTLTAELRGFGGNDTDTFSYPEITWSSSNEDVVKVTPKSNDYSSAVIEGISEGTAYITVDAGEYGTKIVGVNVCKPYVYFFGMNEDDKVYTGEPIETQIYYVYMNGSNSDSAGYREGIDYKVEYKNNIKPGTAAVIVSGIGKYAGSDTGTFNILPAKADIKSLKAGSLKLTVQMAGAPSVCGTDTYEIRYRETGTKEWRTIDCKNASVTVGNLEAGKTYEVQARAYCQSDGEKLYGEWSDVKSSDAISAEEASAPDPSSESAPGSDPKQMGKDGTAVGEGASAAAAEKAITSMTNDIDPDGTVYSKLRLRSSKQTTKSIQIRWNKQNKAVNYVIYGNKCGKKNKPKKLATVKGKNTRTFKKVLGKKVKSGTYYKFIIVALDKNNNVVSTSKLIYVTAKGAGAGNDKKVTVRKSIITKAKKLRKGKTLKLNAKAVAQSKTKAVRRHVTIRYESTNNKIAVVNKKGVVKAMKKGSCCVYAYAQNGAFKKVKVVVN